MIYGSICSGIESATVAWHPLGWRAAFYAEIDRFPSAVLTHHYSDVPNLGDITQFSEWPNADFDVLVGGTPCQSFSVAGLRAGIGDPRGNLALVYLAIVARYRPRWVVWENVPGVLSSDAGKAFGAFIGGLGLLGYGYAWRVLDAQYFRLAQRRKRVFVVGCLGGWQRAVAVLFERESLLGNPAPSREARKDAARTLAGGARKRGGFSYDDIEQVAHARRADGFDASEDGTGRGTPLIPVISPTLRARGNETGGNRPHDMDVDTCDSLIPVISPALKARDSKGPSSDGDGDGAPLIPICFDQTQITSAENRCNPQAGAPSHPLAAGARPPTIAFDCKASGRNGFGVGDIAPTLRAMGHLNSHSNAGGQLAVTTRYAVRRLTPRECERLQGFPDDYTLVPYRGKPAADGPRYKALGNSKAVPVVRWIGRRIDLIDQLLPERPA